MQRSLIFAAKATHEDALKTESAGHRVTNVPWCAKRIIPLL